MKNTIYADNAATSQMDPEALETLITCSRYFYENPSQLYTSARRTRKMLESSRSIIAECIGAHPDEIFFTSGGSESNNWAIKGTIHTINERNTVVTSSIEHHSILKAAESMSTFGGRTVFIHPDHTGTVLPEELEGALDDSVRLVSVMTANNEIGSIQPISELCRMAHEMGALFHTDAVQAVGHIPIDVEALGVDMLSSSAHKFNGPRGFGFLYIRRGTEIEPLVDGGSQQNGMRAGTENLASACATSVALRNNCVLIESNAKKLTEFENLFIDILNDSGVDYVRNGSNNHIPGLISISIKDRDGEALLHRLDLMGFCISTGSACNSQNHTLSHVIEAIGVNPIYADGTIRISFGKYNTEDEVRSLAKALTTILSERINRD